MYALYHKIMNRAEKPLIWLLEYRNKRGKEDTDRLNERKGAPLKLRPAGDLVWVHAASVGEAQSALILIDRLLKTHEGLNILITTGTKSSADFLKPKLPERCFHQYIPLDHPAWVSNFLDHWKPNAALWMESELWPNMLAAIKERKIPAALINARLSEKSYKSWRRLGRHAGELLRVFRIILAQTPRDGDYYKNLGADNVHVSGNIKFSAKPLPYDDAALKALSNATMNRPLWLYASTHDGEEQMACRLHQKLSTTFPDLLTIIVPRHPERRADIIKTIENHNLSCTLRSEDNALPDDETEIYVADTFGELGLFYRLAPIACIGRSFSRDGGGGHNPIEAAQLHCAVLHGPNVQYQQDIFDEMNAEGAALRLRDEGHFSDILTTLLKDEDARHELEEKGAAFAHSKNTVIDSVINSLTPLLTKADIK